MPNAAGSQGGKLCPMQLVVEPNAAGSKEKMQLVVKERSCAQRSW